jgi:hypothetical protein
MLSVREKGGRPDSNRNHKDHDLGCCRYTTTTMSPMPASPASADHRRVGTEIERRRIVMPRSGPDFPRRRGRPDSNRRTFRLTSDCSCR